MAKERLTRRRKPQRRKCPFCEEGSTPDFLEHEKLGKFVTDRGKIVGRGRTGLCSKHQRRLATAIKRARHVAFLR